LTRDAIISFCFSSRLRRAGQRSRSSTALYSARANRSGVPIARLTAAIGTHRRETIRSISSRPRVSRAGTDRVAPAPIGGLCLQGHLAHDGSHFFELVVIGADKGGCVIVRAPNALLYGQWTPADCSYAKSPVPVGVRTCPLAMNCNHRSSLRRLHSTKETAKDVQKEDRTSQSLDKRGRARTQGALEGEDAGLKDSEGGEKDGRRDQAKGAGDRNWHRASPLAGTRQRDC